MQRLSGSEDVQLVPQGFAGHTPPKGVQFWTFGDLKAAFLEFGDILTDVMLPTFGDVMQGHPGKPGGPPLLPTGHGVQFGWLDDEGCEWILSDAEGITDSPAWDAVVAEPAVRDGRWLLRAKASARDVMLRGHVLGPDRDATVRSVNRAASVLSAHPRTGWLLWDAPDALRRLPVAMSGATKVKWRSATWAEVEMQVTGVNIGTPGQGVFFESDSAFTYTLGNNQTVTETLLGAVPSPPTFYLTGPTINRGATITVNGLTIELAEDFTGSRAVIDCANHTVTVDGVLRRSLVSLPSNTWPVLSVGAVEAKASWTGGGSISMQYRGLW